MMIECPLPSPPPSYRNTKPFEQFPKYFSFLLSVNIINGNKYFEKIRNVL